VLLILTNDTTHIYPIKLGPDGQDIAIAFDEGELQSLVKILKKEGGPIAENLIQMFEIDQNDWAQFIFSFHGRFICDKCGEEHIGVRMAKQICEFLTKLLREKYPDCQSIINKLEEKPISDENVSLYGEMSEKYIGKHRCTLKADEYIIPNDSYLSCGILIPLIHSFQKKELIARTQEEKGGKQYQFDEHTGEQILEEKHEKQYEKYQNDLDTVKQILEKCKTGGKRISLTEDERSWLRHWLEDKRRTITYGIYPIGQYGDEDQFELYHIHKCLRTLYSDVDLLDDVEDKINEVIDRYHYSKLDFNKIPPTLVNSVFKLGEHITKGSRCKNCAHDAVNYEMECKETIV
jgi:hypothetical protein